MSRYNRKKDDYIDEQEEMERQNDKLIIFEGISDFFAVFLGILAIFILGALLYSLINWLQIDIGNMIGGL